MHNLKEKKSQLSVLCKKKLKKKKIIQTNYSENIKVSMKCSLGEVSLGKSFSSAKRNST